MGPRAGLDEHLKSRRTEGFDPWTVDPVHNRYTDYVIPAQIWGFLHFYKRSNPYFCDVMKFFVNLRSGFQIVWPGSSVGIVTGYCLDGPGIESQWGRDFSHLSRPALGHTQPPIQGVPCLSRGKERPGCDADPSPPSSAVVMKV